MKQTLALVTLMFLTGCTWDMTAKGWARAIEMCSTFGGVNAASESVYPKGRGRLIKAQCKNMVIATGDYRE